MAAKKTANFGSGVSAQYNDSDDFKKLINKPMTLNHHKYEFTTETPAEVFHNLRKANQTVPVKVTASVARQTVLKNLLTKAVAGGRIAAGIGSGPVGWALTAATAYELVAPALKEEGGYSYDPKQGNFVKPSDGDITIYFYIPNTRSSNERIVSSVELSNAGIYQPYYRDKVVEHLLRTNRKLIVISKDSFTDDQLCKIIDPSYKSESSDICMGPYEKGYTLKAYLSKLTVKEGFQPITQPEFDRIIGPKADASPTRYVNATADEKGVVPDVTVSPNVTVPNGTVVTIGPYTDSDGKPKQVTVTFKTASGETSVSVQVTPRPDLTPNSPSAPSASPNTSGQSSPSGSPNSSGQSSSQTNTQTDGQTNTQTGSQTSPQTGGQTGNQSNPKQDGEPDKKDEDKPKDGSLLCELFPDILACAKVGEPTQDMFDGISIPQTIDERTWEPDDFLPPNGVCPQPKTFHVWGKPVEISYTPLCHFMEQVRFAVLLGFIIMSAFIVFGSLRKG